MEIKRNTTIKDINEYNRLLLLLLLLLLLFRYKNIIFYLILINFEPESISFIYN